MWTVLKKLTKLHVRLHYTASSATPLVHTPTTARSFVIALSLPELDSRDVPMKPHSTRSGSMATVKLQRRARLAEKLREIFEISGIEEVIAGELSVVRSLGGANLVIRNALLAPPIYT